MRASAALCLMPLVIRPASRPECTRSLPAPIRMRARATTPTLTAATPQQQLWWPVLQGPYGRLRRGTVRRELFPGKLWSFEQVQGVIYVHVPVRMTVVRLRTGGLFVYAPVAPTVELLQLLAEVEAEAGPVMHILLPCLALEHKFFAGDFARARPDAQLWVAAAQFSYPLDLPLWLQGLPLGTKLLPPTESSHEVPWAAQLPYRILGPLKEEVGQFQEVVVFDQETGALLVADLVVSVPSQPPAVVGYNDARALLFHARDLPEDEVSDTRGIRAIGWAKICLFSLYFQSSALDIASNPDGSLSGAIRFLISAFPREVPQSMRALGWAGFWPFEWRPAWRSAFKRLRSGGRPVVPPILQVSVLNREPEVVLKFAEEVASDFAFTSLLPCHFDAPVPAGPREWLAAFEFLTQATGRWQGLRRWITPSRALLPEADLAFLRQFDDTLVKSGAIRPPASEGARQDDSSA